MKKKFYIQLFILIFIFSLLFLIPACGDKGQDSGKTPSKDSPAVGEADKIKVVTTIFPLTCIVEAVGGDGVTVTNLLPPGGNPHSYDPTPQDAIAIEESLIIFKLGLKLDDWMDKTISASPDNGKKVVTVCDKVSDLYREIGETPPEDLLKKEDESLHSQCPSKHEEDDEHEAEEEHHHDGVDPHVWIDPLLHKAMAKRVMNILSDKYPKYKSDFEHNYSEYAKQLDELDKKYQDALSPLKDKEYVTFHSFLYYLGLRYGFREIAVVLDSPGKEPDARRLAEIVDTLKKHNVKAVFAEPQFSPKASQTIAREIGGGVYVVDPIGNPTDPQRATYVKNMEENLKSFISAFSPKK